MTKDKDTLIELYQKTIDALPMGILFVDRELRIRLFNNCYASQLGGDVRSTLGRYIVNCIPISSTEGQVLGMVSHIMFTDLIQLKSRNNKIDTLLKRIDFYKKSISSILRSQYSIDCIVGNSKAIQAVKRDILRYATAPFPVLIRGATGTGKELVAHSIHASSAQKEGPFISINCAAIPKELFETELFGYAASAFSGAHRDGKPGQIEMSNIWTLFLDEIGDMPLHAQVKLLRVLEDKKVSRVGSVKVNHVDFRLISATNRDLVAMVKVLFARICIIAFMR